jgi:hypothetical protein
MGIVAVMFVGMQLKADLLFFEKFYCRCHTSRPSVSVWLDPIFTIIVAKFQALSDNRPPAGNLIATG